MFWGMKPVELLASASICAIGILACGSSDKSPVSRDGGLDSSAASGSTSTSSSSSSGGVADSGEVGSAWAQALCAWNDRCNPTYNGILFGSTANCVLAQDKAVASAKAAPDSGMTDQAMDGCATAANAALCTQDPNLLDACIFKGTRAPGTACAVSEQCQRGFCLVGNGNTCGICAAAGSVGESCAQTPCEVPLECDASTHKCVTRAATGGACTSSVFCSSYADRCVNGVCVVGAAKGAPCTSAASATSQDSCGPNLVCSNGSCVGLTVTQQPGDACGNGIECINGACTGDQPPYKCTGHLAEGASCDVASTTVFCDTKMECLSGTCQYPPPAPTCE